MKNLVNKIFKERKTKMENSLNTNDYSLIILFKDSLIYENNNYLLLKKNTNNILDIFFINYNGYNI